MSSPNDVAKGLLAGLAAGLAASLAMELFQRATAGLSSNSGGEDDEPATAKAANRVATAVTGRRLPEEYESLGGEAVHYGTGIALGAAYGAAAEGTRVVTAGSGLLYGGAVWAVVDEGLVPALRLGPPPASAGLSIHAYGLASHLVYGLALEATRRAVRRLL